jgi:hypothetical protein
MSKINLHLTSDSCHIDESVTQLNRALGRKRREPRKALKLILCNLYNKPNDLILVSRRKRRLATQEGNPLGIGTDAFIDTLDALERDGYIHQKLGTHSMKKTTEIKATEKIIDWFRSHHWSDDDIFIFNPQHIRYRLNEKKKCFIDPEHTPFHSWLDDWMKKYNELLNSSSIQLPNGEGVLEDENNILAYKTFIKHDQHPKNGEFLYGGRLVGPGVSMSKEDRKRITINGDPTVEEDRPASHLNAMYSVITGKPCSLDDPYKLTVNNKLVPRHIVKKLASFSQGAKTALGATMSVGYHYKREATKNDAKQEVKDKHSEWLKFIKKTPGTTIHAALMDKHHPIKDYYLRGKQYGDKIQCWEADIVFEVVIKLTERGIPCLTVYDSFIVQEQHQDVLKDIMDNVTFINRREIDKETLLGSP